MVRLGGVEPSTLCLGGRCSIHLSYNRNIILSDGVTRLTEGASPLGVVFLI